MPQLARKRQIAAKIESVEGVAETLTAAEAKHLVDAGDLSFSAEPEKEERAPVQQSLSTHPSLIGVQPAKHGLTVELRGSGVIATEPTWNTFLAGTGVEGTAVNQLAIGAVTGGPFTHGETVTGGTSSATGRVISQTANGDAAVYVVVLTGTFASGEVLTGGTSGATATTSALAAAGGFVYEPISSSIKSLTIASFLDGVRKLQVGARGSMRIAIPGAGKPGRIFFPEFMGVYGGVTDTALLSGITYESTLPPVMLGGTVRLGTFTPIVKAFEMDLGADVGLRTSFAAAKGAVSALLGGRNPTGKITIESELVATYDPYGDMIAGTMRDLEVQIGSVEANRFKIILPQVKIEDVAEGSDGPVSTWDLSFSIPGGTTLQDQEFAVLAY